MKLARKFVEKPWGVTQPPEPFPPSPEKIGEVWFTSPEPLPLMAKHIFTSERLSIQVHPDDAQAQSRGLSSGKSECWYILDAAAGASVGLGLTRNIDEEELRQAALDGSIETLLDWKPVAAGDFFYVPAGTVHAVGGGVSLLEFQQNQDETYRLYDYGRPRTLHLDHGIAVSNPAPYPPQLHQKVDPSRTKLLIATAHFALAHVLAENAPEVFATRRRWIMPVEGEARSGEERVRPGECLLLGAGEPLQASGRLILGAEPAP